MNAYLLSCYYLNAYFQILLVLLHIDTWLIVIFKAFHWYFLTDINHVYVFTINHVKQNYFTILSCYGGFLVLCPDIGYFLITSDFTLNINSVITLRCYLNCYLDFSVIKAFKLMLHFWCYPAEVKGKEKERINAILSFHIGCSRSYD